MNGGRAEPQDGVGAALLAVALERSLDAVVLIEGSGRVRYWNAVAEQVFGFSVQEAVGAFVHDLIVPEACRDRHKAGLAVAAETGRGGVLGERLEVPALHRDGHEVPIELTIAAIPHESAFWFCCTMRDLTAHNAAQEALRRSEERFRYLVETVPGMVYEWALYADGTYGFEQMSPGCRAITGYEPEDFLSGRVGSTDLMFPEDLEAFLASVQASARDLTPWCWEGRMKRGDEVIWTRAESRPVRRQDGATVWYGFIHDVTDAHAATQMLEAANHRLEERVRTRTARLRATQSEIVARLGRAAAYRDDDTGQHIERMSRTCAFVARAMGLAPEACDLLVRAAPMHDIGKIAIPDAILHKPARLDEAEMATMRTHAEIGAQMLSGADSELVRTAETIARTHHERWDGTGYPHGLAGEQIPLVGRIAAVADVFDALTSERPYKRAWTVEAAVAEIERSAGTHFDPAVVAAFLSVVPQLAPVPLPLPLPKAA